MGQVKAHGHKALCLVSGITEHHALVASTLLVLITIIHTTVDVGTLFVNGTQDTA